MKSTLLIGNQILKENKDLKHEPRRLIRYETTIRDPKVRERIARMSIEEAVA